VDVTRVRRRNHALQLPWPCSCKWQRLLRATTRRARLTHELPHSSPSSSDSQSAWFSRPLPRALTTPLVVLTHVHSKALQTVLEGVQIRVLFHRAAPLPQVVFQPDGHLIQTVHN